MNVELENDAKILMNVSIFETKKGKETKMLGHVVLRTNNELWLYNGEKYNLSENVKSAYMRDKTLFLNCPDRQIGIKPRETYDPVKRYLEGWGLKKIRDSFPNYVAVSETDNLYYRGEIPVSA